MSTTSPFSSCLLHSAPGDFHSSLSGSLFRLLLELLELLFEKFKAVAQAHSVVLAHLQQIVVQSPYGAHEEGIKLYEQADVSAKIQTVLQVGYQNRFAGLLHSINAQNFNTQIFLFKCVCTMS